MAIFGNRGLPSITQYMPARTAYQPLPMGPAEAQQMPIRPTDPLSPSEYMGEPNPYASPPPGARFDPMQDELEAIAAGRGGAAPAPPAYIPRTQEEIDARLEQLRQQAGAEFDAANPGRRAYNAARQANPGGRPFTNEELNRLPFDQAQHAAVTLGGNWGNTFGDIDAERGLPGADRNSINAVALRDLIDGTRRAQPVSVMDSRPDEGGGTRNIYPGAPREPTFGGDTVVRRVGGRNMFVDKGEALNPTPYEGATSERERHIMDQIAGTTNPGTGEKLTKDRLRLNRRLGSVVNRIVTNQYDPVTGDVKRDDFGNPLLDPVVAAAREQYLADQKAKEAQTQETGRRNYQLKQMGLRAMPVPEWAMQPQFPGGPPLIAGAMGLGKGGGMSSEDMIRAQIAQQGLASQERIAADNRKSAAELAREENASRERIAGLGVEPKLDPLDAAEVAGVLKQQEAGTIAPEEVQARLEAIRQRRAATNAAKGGAPAPAPAAPPASAPPVAQGSGTPVPQWARQGGLVNGAPLTPGEIVKSGRAAGKSPAEIDAVLKQVTGNSYANITDPDGLGAGDWAMNANPLLWGPEWLFKGKAPAPVRVASRMLGFD